MMDTNEILGTRPAWWVLRYKNGEAFAVSDLPEEKRWTDDDGICQVHEWFTPVAFRKMVDAGEVIIMDYDHEQITQVEFETYREFGIPVVDTINKRGMPVLPCDDTK